jgi:hypothetical protein
MNDVIAEDGATGAIGTLCESVAMVGGLIDGHAHLGDKPRLAGGRNNLKGCGLVWHEHRGDSDVAAVDCRIANPLVKF